MHHILFKTRHQATKKQSVLNQKKPLSFQITAFHFE